MNQHPLKVRYDDLVRMGIVGSRSGLKKMIERGVIRPPHKDGKTHQAAIWWYAEDIQKDLEAERERLTASR